MIFPEPFLLTCLPSVLSERGVGPLGTEDSWVLF